MALRNRELHVRNDDLLAGWLVCMLQGLLAGWLVCMLQGFLKILRINFHKILRVRTWEKTIWR